MTNNNDSTLQLSLNMQFDTMDEARLYCKKVSKQQQFLTVTTD
ncbi:hypothetical protein, partial, partial [Absidia glauca]